MQLNKSFFFLRKAQFLQSLFVFYFSTRVLVGATGCSQTLSPVTDSLTLKMAFAPLLSSLTVLQKKPHDISAEENSAPADIKNNLSVRSGHFQRINSVHFTSKYYASLQPRTLNCRSYCSPIRIGYYRIYYLICKLRWCAIT